MRLSRRALLLGGGAAVASAGYAFAQRPEAVGEPTAIEVRATPIETLSGDGTRRIGALEFRSGLELRSPLSGFGGLSGLWRSPDGRNLVALTDNTQWFTAAVESRSGRLAGLAEPMLAPLLDERGRLLRRTRFYDTEGLTIAGGAAFVSTERHASVLRFDWGRSGVKARAQAVSLPPEARTLPGNGGLEAIAVAPSRSPLAGALIAVAERAAEGDDAPTTGFVLTGPRRGAFQVARSDAFDVTDMAFLPSGEALLLERRFSLLRGIAARLRRIPADAIRPGALVDGPVIFETQGRQSIDNMEGLSLHQAGGETVITLVSDNNFSGFQRTLLLEFTLVG